MKEDDDDDDDDDDDYRAVKGIVNYNCPSA
jgi:hypothetical protein